MAFDVSGLVAHIKENSDDFKSKAITSSKFFDIGFNVIEGIKPGMTEKLPNIEQDAPFYAANSCTINASGTTTPSQMSITTTGIAVSPEWCLVDLEPYFTNQWLGKGAKTDQWSVMNRVMDRLAAKLSQGVGMMMMQGNTGYTNDTRLKQLNGLLSIIDTAGTAIAGNSGSVTVGTGITTSNVLSILDAVIAAIPNRVFTSKMPVVLLGWDVYRTLCTALRNANAFNFYTTAGEFDGKSGLIYPGTSVKIMPISDMNNDNPVETGSLPVAVKNRILALNPDNIYIGTDTLGDMSDFRVWYDDNTNKLKMYCRFSLGINARFFDEIVQFKLV